MADELVVEHLTVERAGRTVVRDVSFTLAPGDVVTVVGPNGAGKSSLLEAILGLLPRVSGSVTFGGIPVRDLGTRACVFSYMPDDAEPPSEVRVTTLVAHAERFGQPPSRLATDLIELLGLKKLLGERAGNLSRGQKRRVLLFTALCTSRPVAVLDEPFAAFDPLQLLDLLPVLRARAAAGVALLLTVHQMSDAERIASRVLVLDVGRVVAWGSLSDIRAQANRPDGSLEDAVIDLLRARGDPDARA
jgi:ABC-type multidrug transport system ATPase subunit